MLAIGKAAAAEAAANVEKSVEDKDDMDDDAQARYYRCDASGIVKSLGITPNAARMLIGRTVEWACSRLRAKTVTGGNAGLQNRFLKPV